MMAARLTIMRMYDNSNIIWHSGMELTPAVFRNLEGDLSQRQKVMVRAALADGRIGILPETDVCVDGAFVRKTFEMTGMRLTALTASGEILAVDADLQCQLPKLSDGVYLLCVGASAEHRRQYERDGIQYEAPAYELSVVYETDAEALAGDVIPVKRMVVADGTLTIDARYIVPALAMSADARFCEYRDRIAAKLEAIATHVNMDEGDCKRTLLQLLFRLRSLKGNRMVRDLTDLLQEIGMAVQYYVLGQLGKTLEECPEAPRTLDADARREPWQHNIAAFLDWMEEYLTSMLQIMEKVVIVDNTIDYEKLKAELREDIYAALREEVYEKMIQEMHDKLHGELTDELLAEVKRLIDEELEPRLQEKLNEGLYNSLYPALYDALYNALYAILHQEEMDARPSFMPLI